MAAVLLFSCGCATSRPVTVAPTLPDVGPVSEDRAQEALHLDPSIIAPIHHEVLTIDLPAVAQVALADSLDVQQARLAVAAAQGRLDSAVGKAFPALAPAALFEIVDGKVRATQGNIVSADFNTFFAFLTVDWVLNPGRVWYEALAARKRLEATEHQERAVLVGTLHRAVVQYYDLALAQSRVGTANQALHEARELLRINELRQRAGTGVPADTLRAEAHLAEREQDLTLAMNAFYQASVALAVTLRLDSAVTLVPGVTELYPTELVRKDLDLDELLAMAVQYRPDLESLRSLAAAAEADAGATWWGGFGPGFQSAYVIGGISGHVEDPDNLETESSFSGTQRFAARAGFRLDLSTLGDVRTARAVQQQALLEALRALDLARAQVVTAVQASKANTSLIEAGREQVQAAQEALRLTQANLQAGTMTTLDVLEAEESVARARFRYAQAVVGYNQSQVDLLAALGMVTEHTLGLAAATAGPQFPGAGS